MPVPSKPADNPSDPGSFVGHARTVAGLTLVSRISGLARDAICSRVFGTSAVWSAFVTAFIIPNLFRRLFGEGALSAAFIPRYTALLESHEDPERAGDAFASLTVWLLAGVLGGLTLIAELVLLAVLLWGGGEAGGLEGSARELVVLAMLMLPYMPLVCITAILGGMLQVRGRFAPHAAAPVLLNVAMSVAAIVGTLAFESLSSAAYLVAVGVVLAGVLQIVWCVRRLRGLVRWRLAAWDAWKQVRGMLLAMGPVIVGMGALQLSSLVDALIAGYPLAVGPMIGWGERAIAYPLDEASAAVLYFAQRLYQFPLGVFGIAIATAVFPALARAGARLGEERHPGSGIRHQEEKGAAGDGGALYVNTLREGIRLSLFIAWPATLGLIVVREPLTAVLYAGGDFGSDDVSRVAAVLAGYAMAVWAYGLTHVFTRAFYALGDMKTPMKAGLVSVLANIGLNLILIWPLREAGLAWSTAICASGQALALAWMLRRRVLRLPGASGRLLDVRSARSVLLTVVAGLGMFLLLLGMDALVLGRLWAEVASWTAHASSLGVLMITGAGLYAAMALAFRLPELGWVLRAVGLRRSSPPGSPDNR